jgi:uncharacterized membrane protein YesL
MHVRGTAFAIVKKVLKGKRKENSQVRALRYWRNEWRQLNKSGTEIIQVMLIMRKVFP